MIRVFIGYDSKMPLLTHVFAQSLLSRASRPVCLTPIVLAQLKGAFDRSPHPLQSSEFSFSRFLAPYLCDFEGWSIFADNDMLARDDIAKLWDLRDDKYAVMVVKHDHRPVGARKFLNMPQTAYEKKNWSSLILFNNRKCHRLTADYVSTASGLDLHQFKWLDGEDAIGSLPSEWNHLVGYDAPNPGARIVHYTLGGPYFKESAGCEFAEEWFAERDATLGVRQLG